MTPAANLPQGAALAPMAGVADRAFRELCMQAGAVWCVGELTSAKGIVLGSRKSEELLQVFAAERPMGVQLFGNDPAVMAAAARKALAYEPDFIDINMGCPAPKVAGNGGGSALLKDVPLAARVVAAVKAVSPVPVTVKMRTGWDEHSIVAVELAKAVEAAGADRITVHGRTRAQMYAPPADWQAIAAVKAAVTVPVVGNGDIATPDDALAMLRQTGCDGIMVGRAAMGAPWLFGQIAAFLQRGERLPAPGPEQRMATLLDQARRMCEYKDPYTAMLQIRKHAAWYIKGLPGAAALRRQCGQIATMDGLRRLVDAALNAWQKEEL